MATNNSDGLGVALTIDDLTFLRNADGLESAYKKIQTAKLLISEARAEIMQALSSSEFTPAKSRKKSAKVTKAPKATKTAKKLPKVDFGVDVPEPLSDTEKAVFAAVKKGVMKMPALVEKTGLTPYQAKAATRELKLRGLIELHGFGPTSEWKVA